MITVSFILFIQTSTVISKYVSRSQSKTGRSLASMRKWNWQKFLDWLNFLSITQNFQKQKANRTVKMNQVLFTYLFFLFFSPFAQFFSGVPTRLWLLLICLFVITCVPLLSNYLKSQVHNFVFHYKLLQYKQIIYIYITQNNVSIKM